MEKLKAKPEALAARGRVPAKVDPLAGDTPLARFSRELATRFPKLEIKRFVMPASVRDCREIFFREAKSTDEVEAAIMAEQMMSPIERASERLAQEAQRREVIRLTLVGVGEGEVGSISYRHVNHDGVPVAAIENWTARAWTSMHTYYGELNGVPTSELREGIKEARIVGAFASPTGETPPSA